ncbi:MAG: hypothetical protein JXR37_13135 [Kiritimatiellae bacterium]|nr:hypothetical protein [Kiritimatiellia bacterium]
MTRCAIGLLAGLGLGLTALRFQARAKGRLPPGDSVWRVEIQTRFRAARPGARLAAAVPTDTSCCRLFRQSVSHAGIRTDMTRSRHSRELEIHGVAMAAGPHQFDLQYDIHLSPHADRRNAVEPRTLNTEQRVYYLRHEPHIQVADPAVLRVLADLRKAKLPKSELVERIFEYCYNHIAAGTRAAPQDAAGVLRDGLAAPPGQAAVMVALCRAAKVPARLVAGLELVQGAFVHPHVWVEVFVKNQWAPYDPLSGFAREMPAHYLPVSRSGTRIVAGDSAVEDLRTIFNVRPISAPRGLRPAAEAGLGRVLDLTALPLERQRTLAVILLLPFGGLLTSVLRNVVGLRTFGTFTPALLALSFVYADWLTGILILLAALLAGLAVRAGLARLQILAVPRLSIVLTTVVVSMVLVVSALNHREVTPAARTVLLPLVILSMLVERFFITAEEDSLARAFALLVQTLAVGICCHMVLRWRGLGDTVLTYPELHFITAAALIGVGRYTGYRLNELWRFRDMIPKQTPEGSAP